MKKIIISTFIIVMSAFVTSCDNFSLDLSPEDYFASGSFWQNEDQVNGAMIGIHSQLRGFHFTFWHLGEIRGGLLREGTGFTGTSSLNAGNLIRQDLRESSPGFSNWASMYPAIFQINNFIYQVEQADYMSPAKKGYYLGQAYGLRAHYYFWLYRTYGRVPLVTEPKVAISTPSTAEEVYTPRSQTEKETLDLIKADIEKSIQSFGSDNSIKMQKAQWSLPASQMLKAEVYLWSAKVMTDGQAPTNVSQDLETAKSALQTVIPQFSLLDDYKNVFTSASVPSSKGNSEIIFALRFLAGEATNGIAAQMLYASADNLTGFVDENGESLAGDPLQIASSGTLLRYEYKYDTYTLYDKEDTRANATFKNFNKGDLKAVANVKYLGTFVNGIRNYSDDYPMYRLADAYLMLAEIKNKLGEDPSSEIMAVRNRAYNGEAPQFTNGSFEENELAIFWERTKEFVNESKRWFDLRRMQSADGNPLVFKTDIPLIGVLQESEKHKVLWPIDLGTMSADPTITGDQNPGYSGT